MSVAAPTVEGQPEKDKDGFVAPIQRESVQLFKEGSDSLFGRANRQVKPKGKTGQGGYEGMREHPQDFALLKEIIDRNDYHSTCVRTKNACTVGLGFVTPEEIAPVATGNPVVAVEQMLRTRSRTKVDDALDPLCIVSFQDVLSDVCEDYWSNGNGYIEIHITKGEIDGITHLPSEQAWVNVRHNNNADFNYVVDNGTMTVEWERYAKDQKLKDGSYLAHFRQPTCRDTHYGRADWTSALTPIELMACLQQYRYDFFNNRGVPEFLLFLLGRKVDQDTWDEIKSALQANIGRGNSHKTLAANIQDKDLKVQVEKLAMEQTGFDDTKFKEGLALDIVSAHRVPPLLAGILIPGKLGATNELPNSLMAFQVLVIAQAQRVFQNQLIQAFSGFRELTDQDFTLRTVTSIIDYQSMDTVSRMRQSMPEAVAEGRNLSDGLKD